MRGVRTVSVVDALVASLRDRVLDGEIDPGRGLTESDLATDSRVSRPSARTSITRIVVHAHLLCARDAPAGAGEADSVAGKPRRAACVSAAR